MYPINKTKQKLRNGEFAFGVSLSDISGITLPHIFASLGFDFLFFDMEHSADGFNTMCDMVWASRCAGITPIPRAPDSVSFYISRPLDAGAQGIVVPRIETVEQVQKVVGYSRYPPLGERGAAFGGRHMNYQPARDLRETMDEANEQVLLAIQIETTAGVERVEELAAQPGIDLIFIGPQDLSVALGVPGEYNSPKMDKVFDRIIAAAARNGLPVGVQGRNIELSARWMEQGIRFVVFGSAMMLLTQAAREGMARLNEVGEKLNSKPLHVAVKT